jgi:hypothetical protein
MLAFLYAVKAVKCQDFGARELKACRDAVLLNLETTREGIIHFLWQMTIRNPKDHSLAALD